MNEIDENNDIWDLKQKEFEADPQFNFRKEIYDNVFNDKNSKKKATLYSNIWVNVLSMECKYSAEIMKQIEKYKPNHNIYDLQEEMR